MGTWTICPAVNAGCVSCCHPGLHSELCCARERLVATSSSDHSSEEET